MAAANRVRQSRDLFFLSSFRIGGPQIIHDVVDPKVDDARVMSRTDRGSAGLFRRWQYAGQSWFDGRRDTHDAMVVASVVEGRGRRGEGGVHVSTIPRV